VATIEPRREGIMKESMSRISRGWSFAAGTLLGALAVVSMVHGSSSRAEAAEKQSLVTASAASLPSDTVSAAEYQAADWVVKADSAKKDRSTASKASMDEAEHRLPGHSELDLQCD
jgi:hypothetical protein